MNKVHIQKEVRSGFAIAAFVILASIVNWYFYFAPPDHEPVKQEPALDIGTMIRIGAVFLAAYFTKKSRNRFARYYWGFLLVNAATIAAWDFIGLNSSRAASPIYLTSFSILFFTLVLFQKQKNVSIFDWQESTKTAEGKATGA